MRRLLLRSALLAAAAVTACRTPGGFTPSLGGVEVSDTLDPLIQAVRAAKDDEAAGQAWWRALDDLSMPPVGVKLGSLGKAIRAALPQLEAVSASGPSEAREVAAAVGALHGRSVTARVRLVALREEMPLLLHDHFPDLITLNARSPDAADPRARRALLARAMSAQLLPDADSLSPLAKLVYARSLSAAAALAVVPGAPAPALTDRPEEEIAKLRPRLPLLARELLAALDSAAPAQVDRFFSVGPSPDPLLPRGSGAFLCAELGAALARDLGGAEKVVRLSPGEFRRQASQALQRLATAP